MIARKAVQICLLKIPAKSVKEVVAEGFAQRQWVREQKRIERREYSKIYAARKREEEAALAKKRSSAMKSFMEAERAKPQKTKGATV